MRHTLWIVVPFHNEEGWIATTVRALASQVDQNFAIVFVDNASTDLGRRELGVALAQHPSLSARVIDEQTKGVGAAADTGIRYAIAHGAEWVARTDADCIPSPNWTRWIRHAMQRRNLDLMAGRLLARYDDDPQPLKSRLLHFISYEFMRKIAPWVKANRDPNAIGKFIMTSGGNMAIRAKAYEESGGYPRECFGSESMDRALMQRVRRVTNRVGFEHRAIVRHSLRRVRSYGFRGTLEWYRDHKIPESEEIDVR